jgi:hypothetical protein
LCPDAGIALEQRLVVKERNGLNQFIDDALRDAQEW